MSRSHLFYGGLAAFACSVFTLLWWAGTPPPHQMWIKTVFLPVVLLGPVVSMASLFWPYRAAISLTRLAAAEDDATLTFHCRLVSMDAHVYRHVNGGFVLFRHGERVGRFETDHAATAYLSAEFDQEGAMP